MSDWKVTLLILIVSTIRMSTPITLAAVGGAFSARSGTMALGLEGFMLMGAWGAALGSYLFQNAFLGLFMGILVSLIFSLLFGVFTIRFHVNQVICGIGFNLFASGFTASMTQMIWGTRANSDQVPTLPRIHVPGVGDLSILIPVMLIVVAVSWFYLFRTPSGLRMRIVGESAHTADSIGLKVNRYKYLGILISGAVCGMAGSFLSIDHVNMFVREMTAGRGFIAVAVNILGRFNPLGALGGGLLFGFADSLQLVIPSAMVPGQILQMIPYAVTLFVIIFAVRYVSTPAGIGEVLEH
ncbi:MAG: ABC transporter permease [Clostridiaceae bacterium]|nr:ABC transporter permease [Clostridiaceae bacterium]